MTLTITKGMAGRKVETVGKYTSAEIDKMNADFADWKKANQRGSKYRVQWYDRILFNEAKRQLVIDFGDYSYFGLVRANKSEWKAIIEHKSKPVDLEV